MVFTVNNQQWILKFVNPNSKELTRSDGSITLGMTDNNVKSVFINNRLNNYMTDKVLAHELCHIFSFSFGSRIIGGNIEDILCKYIFPFV